MGLGQPLSAAAGLVWQGLGGWLGAGGGEYRGEVSGARLGNTVELSLPSSHKTVDECAVVPGPDPKTSPNS